MTIYFLIPAIVWFAATLAWDLITDGKKFIHNVILNHTKEWWIRMAVISPSVIFFSIVIAHSLGWKLWLLYIVISGAMVGFWYWTLFDGLYNKHILKVRFWELKGTTAKLDRFLNKIGETKAKILKITLCSLFTLIYCIILTKKYNL